MKPNRILSIALLFIALVLLLVLANITPSFASTQNTGTSISLQITPTPAAEGVSEIGSTDGIMLMGVIISLIIIIPLLFRRKKN